jgi:hypothetical protein
MHALCLKNIGILCGADLNKKNIGILCRADLIKTTKF